MRKLLLLLGVVALVLLTPAFASDMYCDSLSVYEMLDCPGSTEIVDRWNECAMTFMTSHPNAVIVGWNARLEMGQKFIVSGWHEPKDGDPGWACFNDGSHMMAQSGQYQMPLASWLAGQCYSYLSSSELSQMMCSYFAQPIMTPKVDVMFGFDYITLP